MWVVHVTSGMAIIQMGAIVATSISLYPEREKKKKKEILVLNDSKSNGWEKIENINLECYSQIFEET